MNKRILILGASGTVGAAIFKGLSRCEDWTVLGTYCSAEPEDTSSMLPFSLEFPQDIRSVLEEVHPDIVVSSLGGPFEKQLIAHEIAADYLMANNGRLLYLSTANVFDAHMGQPHYEGDTRSSDNDYGRFKMQCEELLQKHMGSRAVLIRLPFVWGRHSPRIQAVRAGCEAGRLEVYTDFSSNHVSDMQVADLIRWIIKEDKEGIFHIGTADVIAYQEFIQQLISAMDLKRPKFLPERTPGVLAVLSSRNDIPDALKWSSERLIRYLSGGKNEGRPGT